MITHIDAFGYMTVHLSDVFFNKYTVLRKLGWASGSSVWLCVVPAEYASCLVLDIRTLTVTAVTRGMVLLKESVEIKSLLECYAYPGRARPHRRQAGQPVRPLRRPRCCDRTVFRRAPFRVLSHSPSTGFMAGPHNHSGES
ncbi:hypothetical protein BD413DRAFT_275500 [Trametes elegans]|nr:hypothetical protein BD413DRAFT_275500 [Trametes elegans]